VLERDNRSDALSRFEAEWGLAPGQLQDITAEEDLWDDWATGRTDESTFWRRALVRRDVDVPDPAPLIETVAHAVELDPAVFAIAQELRRRYKLALLTNNTHEWLRISLTRYPLVDLFPVIVSSADVGMRKPDPRIYQQTCERLGVTPAECLFIDDRSRNTKAAEALGMRAIVFRSAKQLQAALDTVLPQQN
jgi:putative hydrolase of the HAD superfamily